MNSPILLSRLASIPVEALTRKNKLLCPFIAALSSCNDDPWSP